jgi:hypothetical protein
MEYHYDGELWGITVAGDYHIITIVVIAILNVGILQQDNVLKLELLL